ncbi:DUF2865 domain-containing protein [Brucella anthropi]|uniref:DUF2865 domain-containing protein n=1 Tax=Brucella anthropi TaxID=529 RepID=UPI000288F655|nr:DUF2865 domain-containing protein [Brucella anthropi]
MGKLTLFVIFVLAISSFPDLSALASSCRSRQSATDPAVKMLQRQLSALRAIQRGRGCKPGESGGGLFNACREVGMKISEVQQELSAVSAIDRECRAESRAEASGIKRPKATNASSPAGLARTGPSADEKQEKIRGARKSLQYCVRLSDGYYFPTPNSQFSQKGGTDAALVQCRMICDTIAMAVYVNDQNEEASEMISVANGQPYADLPTAYDYHGEGDFKRCDWNGYVAKVAELHAARKRPKQLKNVEIPLPDARPEEDVTAVAEIPSTQFRQAPIESVRMVGPAFIPDVDNEAFGRMRRQQ